MFFYRAYSLNIQSTFLLPELIATENEPDVFIEPGRLDLPSMLPTTISRQHVESLFGGTAQSAYLQWPGVVSFWAKNGNRLIVEPASEDIDPQLVSMYILSEALGLILYQRGLFLLHASAVQIGSNVLLFVGCPGAGKSTLAAAFAREGFPILGDDMVALSWDLTGQVVVHPAFPQIKIWRDSVVGLGYDQASLPPLFAGSQKHVIQNKNSFPDLPTPLSDIFLVEEGSELRITELLGMNAFLSLARFFSLPTGLLQGSAYQQHFQDCIKLANTVNIWKIENPKNFGSLKQLTTLLENNYKVLA